MELLILKCKEFKRINMLLEFKNAPYVWHNWIATDVFVCMLGCRDEADFHTIG